MPDVTLVTDSDGRNTSVISIEIITPVLSFLDAINYSQRMANRCTDVLSFISGYGVACSLKQINEIGEEVGAAKIGAIFFSVGGLLVKPGEVDLTKPAFSRVIQEKDKKLARQFSHFRLGISSLDVIEQIREFYQIIEDEYGENDPKTQKYKCLRNLLSHPELIKPESKAAAIAMVGKSYLDPSEPSDISVLLKHLVNLKNDAMCIIESKIQKVGKPKSQ